MAKLVGHSLPARDRRSALNQRPEFMLRPDMTDMTEFGTLPDGTVIHCYTLGNEDGLQARILDFGATLQSLSYPGRNGRTQLILGLETLAGYMADPCYFGIIAGRFANRIANGRYTQDGREIQLAVNEGPNHLHGGLKGLGKRVWKLIEHKGNTLRLGYHSPDGEEGYPGNMDIEAAFTLQHDSLELIITGRSDARTLVNMTHHPYFNLAGSPSVPAAEQILDVPADRFLPVIDSALIPTGEIAATDGTPFDFRKAVAIKDAARIPHPQMQPAGGYDHCLVMAEDAPYSAELYSPQSDIRMRIESRMPALQFYGGQGVAGPHPSLGDGICLEPQGYPDAPNHAAFPDTFIEAGEVFENRIVYRFSRG